jgi:predicted ATP-dependent serine protease
VPQIERRLIEAGKIGFRSAIVPTIEAEGGNYSVDIDLHPVGTIDQALAIL